MKILIHEKIWLAVYVSLFIAAVPVFAQSPASKDTSDADSAAPMQEIVVTAQRRAQSLSEIPYNLSIISDATLERAGIQGAGEVARLIPGLSITGTGGRDNFRLTLRGLRTGEEGGTDVTTTSYVDETPIDIPGLATVDLRLLDIERIEVLRGPQGTLYGAGAIGGTLRYITRKPELSAYETRVTTGFSDTRDGGLNYRGAVMLNLPLIDDRVALRLNAGYEQQDGYIDDIGLDRDNVNDERRIDSRISVFGKVSDKITLEGTHYYQGGSFGSNNSFDTRFAPRTTRYDVADAEDPSIHLLNFTANFGTAIGSLVSSTNYARGKIDTSTDETIEIRDVIYASFIEPENLPEIDTLSARRLTANYFAQEFRFVTDDSRPLSAIFGAFYARNEGAQRYRDIVANFPFPGIADFEAYTGYLIADDTQYAFRSEQQREQLAGFTEVTYRLTPALQLSLGGRVFRYETEGEFWAIDNYFGVEARDAEGISRTEPFAEEFTFGRAEDTGIIFKLNGSWNWGDDNLLYATIASGYRPGGFNLVSTQTGVSADQFEYQPDEIINYEIGGRLFLNPQSFFSGDVYFIDWTDIQTQEQTDLGFAVLGNAGKARVRGLELEFNSQDLLAPGLAVGFSYGYTDGELTETVTFLGFSGDKVPFVAEHTGAFQLDYEYGLANDTTLGFNATVSYRDEIFTRFGAVVPSLDDDGNPVTVENPAYIRLASSTVTDISVRLTTEQWQARVFVDNLLDTEPQSNAEVLLTSGPFNNGPVINRFIGRPRTIGIEASYKF
jgi:iron complex outermembrane recepter protein